MSLSREPVPAGLTELIALPLLERSFVSGKDNAHRLRVRYFSRDADSALVAQIHFGAGAEGPPRHAHGGSIAAALDEAMGLAAWLSGHKAVARRISVEFKRLVPLGTEATLEAWVEHVDGRKVTNRGRLRGPKGELYAESEGLFIVLDDERFGEMAGGK
jgi:acyl-coenzyme A thioesterase PaaI-like protein